jgi:hypothetical protein
LQMVMFLGVMALALHLPTAGMAAGAVTEGARAYNTRKA